MSDMTNKNLSEAVKKRLNEKERSKAKTAAAVQGMAKSSDEIASLTRRVATLEKDVGELVKRVVWGETK